MLRTKKADRIVCIATVVMLLASVLLWGVVEPVRGDGSHFIGYENRLFDQSRVHTIDITMAGWDNFIKNATNEEYAECNIAVDGERYSHVAIRAKGNTSLSSVATLGSTRYSFKVEFDHYVKGMTYHGLDKLSLNNLIQDASMMKDYLAYTLMGRMNVPVALCSYVQINVNGEPWGLYLAVEGIEDSFLDRNGMTKGELYKPDSLGFGGGRGNGRDFDFEKFRLEEDTETTAAPSTDSTSAPAASAQPEANNDGASFGGSSGVPAGGQGNMPQGDFGASDGGTAQQGQQPQGDFGASGGNSAQQGQMPQGDFSPSGGDSAQQATAAPETSERPADGENRERPSFGGDMLEGGPGGGGFGGFNFGMGNDDVKLIYSGDNIDNYSNIFDNAKTKIKKKDKLRLIETLRKLNAKEDLDEVVNKNEVIRYLAVHNFLCNDDSYTGMMVHNYYLYEEKGKLSILPWDYNLGFGGFSASTDATSTVNSPIDSPVSGGTTESRPLIAWIFTDDEALAAYHEAYDRFISENIESGWLESEIERVRAMIAPYVEKDASAFYSMSAFEKGVDTLQTFCKDRGESVRGQLDGTIPSTSAEQRSNDALIDASDISTADMGSMNNGNGGGSGGGSPGEMPSGMPDFSNMGSGFTPPEGFTLPEGFTPPTQGGNDPFGGSAGGSNEQSAQATDAPSAQETSPAAQPETAASTEAQSSAQPADSAAPSQTGERQGPPSGFPGGGDFPGSQQTNQTGQWVQAAICTAVLLFAILLIRKAGDHNG